MSRAKPRAKSKASSTKLKAPPRIYTGRLAAEGVRKTASSFEDVVRRTIEDKPYTAVAIALALGWLFGRTHQPI